MFAYSYKYLISIILLLLCTTNLISGEIVLSKYIRNTILPIYANPDCQLSYHVQLNETQAGYVINTPITVSHSGSAYSPLYQNATAMVFEVVFNLLNGTNNTLSLLVSDDGGSYNLTLDNVECKELPQKVSIVSTYIKAPVSPFATTISFKLDFDMSQVSYFSTGSGNYMKCNINSTLYMCSIYRDNSVSFPETLYIYNLIDPSQSYDSPVVATYTYEFPTITYSYNFTLYPVPREIIDTPVASPNITTYPPASSVINLPPGAANMAYVTVDVFNVKDAIITNGFYVNYPMLKGNEEHSIFYGASSSGFHLVQMRNESVDFGSSTFSFTSSTPPMTFTMNNYPDPNFYQLLQLSSNSINDFSPITIEVSTRHYTSFITNYPFGLTLSNHSLSGSDIFTSTNFQYSATFAMDNNTFDANGKAQYRGTQSQFNYQYSSPSDTQVPLLDSLQYYILNTTTVLVVAKIRDDKSGARSLTIAQTDNFFLDLYLVEGNSLNGTYAIITYFNDFVYNEPRFIEMSDNAGKGFGTSTSFYDINMDLIPFVRTISYYTNIENITFCRTYPDIVDTSNGPVNATLFINTTNIDKEYYNSITYATSPISSQWLPFRNNNFYWDFTNEMYRLDYQIPGRSVNTTVFSTIFSKVDSYSLEGYIGLRVSAYVFSNYSDQLAPLVTNWNVFPSPNVTIQANDQKTSVGFLLTVLDQPNGLKEGEIQFISNIDGLPYVFQFNDTTRIAGDIYNGTYRFTIDIMNGTCVNQTFYLFSMKLVDIYGAISTYPNQDAYINSMFQVQFDPTKNLMLQVVCEKEAVDLVLPYIADFSFTPKTIDVGSEDRNISFTLTTRDNESGLSPRHNPVIYLSGIFGNSLFRVDSYQHTIHNTSSTTYQYSTTIPYAFSTQNILVSVYGIVDNYLNLKGYSSLDLKNSSLDYFIQTIFKPTEAKPTITSSSKRLFQHGGNVTVSGRGFGNDITQITSFVDYQDGKGFVQVPTIFCQYVAAALQVEKFTSTFIVIKFHVGNADSNEFRIDRIEYQPVFNFNGEAPPEPPKPISCSNNCSGNGNCTFNGCVCQDPWYGPSCSTKTIIVPPPITNTSDPVIIIDTGGGSGGNSTSGNSTTSGGSTTGGDNGNNQGVEVKSIISIYSLREVTLAGKMVNEFFPSNWTFTNETNIDGSNGLKFHYSSKLKDRDTIFNVTIQYFTNQSTIEFAGQPITLPPYSTKMSMSLDGYKFNSYLNNLQIIMNIELMTPNQGVQCTSKQYGLGGGNTHDLQWMKLNIDDKSLYGNFIRRGIIDGRVTSITNSLLDDTFSITKSQQSQQTYIGINIPFYRTDVTIDPDFSHLLEVSGDDSNGGCGQSNSSQNDKGLKTGAIVGIVVGGAIAVALIIGISMFVRKRRREINSSRDMDAKLKRLSQGH